MWDTFVLQILYEFDESHEALHIFRDIFQNIIRSSTRTASIPESVTSVLEDFIKASLSWKYPVHELTTPEQTATGKEISNPFIVDSLLKTISSSMSMSVQSFSGNGEIKEKFTSYSRKSEIKMKLSNLVIHVSKNEFLQKHKCKTSEELQRQPANMLGIQICTLRRPQKKTSLRGRLLETQFHSLTREARS
ncbi:hypothetical protein Tco_0411555 [Tanacetum coccineum]